MSADGSRWSFEGPTAPFFDAQGLDPARFVLQQVDDDRFRVTEPILYVDGATTVRVPRNDSVSSDLASIPFFMAWFVPVNGRHTPAALVHDTLLGDLAARRRAGSITDDAYRVGRAEADGVFLSAMASCGVPLLRRGLMFAAVTIATRWSARGAARLGIAAWVLLSVLGSIALVWGVLVGAWAVVAASILAPLPAALLWGRQWRPGILAGCGSWLIGLPALATALGYGAYWLVEQAVRPLAARGAHEPISEAPPPAPYR